MSNTWFRFQQFTIHQGRTAMKVGTDGVLLGCWAGIGLEGRQRLRILDVGTGSGLIAMMMSQRFADARVEAVELDPDSAAQAVENVEQSPWPDRIRVIEADFNEWMPPDEGLFDLIVCNPPYFSRSLQNPDQRRASARHDHALTLDDLMRKASALLTDDGHFSLIVPAERADETQVLAERYHLWLCRRLEVRGHSHAPVKRILLEWSPTRTEPVAESLVLERARGIRSEEWDRMTGAFFCLPTVG